MFTLDPLNEATFSTEEENPKFSKIKLVKTLATCNVKSIVDATLKQSLEKDFKKIREIIERAEKEFQFAGFSVDKKCEDNLLKSIQEFDKTNKQYTPIDILELEKYHRTRLKIQVHLEVLQDADIPTFYSLFYRSLYHFLIAEYEYVDMIMRFIDGRYVDIIVFGYRTRFGPGKILANFVVASPNPLDINAPVVLCQTKFNPDWFGKPVK